MATYLKRSSKLLERLAAVNSGRTNNSNTSSTRNNNRISIEPLLRDVICPVCRTILREPVTLPCAHNLCLRCLRGTVEYNSLSCPLCRQRVGSWLRNATKTESLVNIELWHLIRRRFPDELELAVGESSGDGAVGIDLDLHSEFNTKKIISAAGEIRREYEVQLQMAKEETWRQQEKERLASETFIQKIQEEEEQHKLMQLAQDQLLAKTLAKQEVLKNSNTKHNCSNKSTILNSYKSKSDVNQSKSIVNQKMSVKTKETIDKRKQNLILISKIRSERYACSVKCNSTNAYKDSSETFSSHKPVPIYNAVTRIVTHQSRVSQSNNSTCSYVMGDFIGSTSKIYGLQNKEELHVPKDILSNKKKKLGVEICIGTIEGEERIGSAESAGSHDSINQEIHHFKPIKALPRTPLRITLDGRQIDPKLIRVLPVLKQVSNVIPKPPTPTHLKKIFGCSWSAFKRISRQQQTLLKDVSSIYQQETQKTEIKSEQLQIIKSNKSLQEIDMHNTPMNFDKNKNYTKNVTQIINGAKFNKKLNLDCKEPNDSISVKRSKEGKLKNGLLRKNKKSINKTIEIVEIEDNKQNSQHIYTSDPLKIISKFKTKPLSPVLEIAMENIAERIKKRKITRTSNNTENVQSPFNLMTTDEQLIKLKSKKSHTKSLKSKIMEMNMTIKMKPKTKTKMRTVTTVTSQIKRLTAKSIKRRKYTEDSEEEANEVEREEEEDNEVEREEEENEEENIILDGIQKQKQMNMNEKVELNRFNVNCSYLTSSKNYCKNSKQKKIKKSISTAAATTMTIVAKTSPNSNDDEEKEIIKEQQRLEQLAVQEREDRELAFKLQARFNAMERIAGRTRRGAARIPNPLLN
ncbi:PREDICTED: uncharacterized protein LOC105361480 [Ceratosolen solmsi marchali]|uniref:RING-type E3 ubiquitin transferase n=1 Tax=Ceratosolen solmsi marchali TaxID=326594 RepID=A0AAJ6YF96_9HYME|nr:PREDICTED: uncharacterized protein LOC105361480 [Ceratosolen solmsi marchali]